MPKRSYKLSVCDIVRHRSKQKHYLNNEFTIDLLSHFLNYLFIAIMEYGSQIKFD